MNSFRDFAGVIGYSIVYLGGSSTGAFDLSLLLPLERDLCLCFSILLSIFEIVTLSLVCEMSPFKIGFGPKLITPALISTFLGDYSVF